MPSFIPALFDNLRNRTNVAYMKDLRKFFMALAVGAAVSGSLPAQDKSALVQPVTHTNTIPDLLLERKLEPHFDLGSRTLASGLVVDFIEPAQTWDLLNPALPVPRATPPAILMPPAVVAPRPVSEPENHGPNFAILRISFP
jgi:hypothetical protein